MTSQKQNFARQTLWNLVGMCTPMVVALVAIPVLVDGLGRERFGLLSLVWMLVGYLSIFDLGLGRALTQGIAQRLGEGRHDEIPSVFWTAFLLLSALGVATGAGAWFGTPWLVHRGLNIDPALQPETLAAFRAVALALPATIGTAGLIGVLEAYRRFGLINAIRIPTGAYTFLGPILVLPFSRRLDAVVLALLAGRIVGWLLYFGACLTVARELRTPRRPVPQLAASLFRFGSWMTVSNVIHPLLMHIDRFLIGALRRVVDVTYYATPAEIVVKMLILPRAWATVLFPSFAGDYRERPERTAALYLRGCRYLLAGLFPIPALLVAIAPEFLSLWLGADFGPGSGPVMRLLAVALFLFSLAYLPSNFIQAVHRPDLLAKVNLVELPLYLGLTSVLIRTYGITGAACAGLLRGGIELVLFNRFALRLLHQPPAALARVAALTALDLALLVPLAGPWPWPVRLALLAAACTVHTLVAWRWMLLADDRLRMAEQAEGLVRRFIRSRGAPSA